MSLQLDAQVYVQRTEGGRAKFRQAQVIESEPSDGKFRVFYPDLGVDEWVDHGQMKQMNHDATGYLPAAPGTNGYLPAAPGSVRTASPPALNSPMSERFSAAPGRDSVFAQDHKLEWVHKELSSLRESLSEERKTRMALEMKLQDCLDQTKAARQSSSAALEDLQAVVAEEQVHRRADARTLEQLAEKAQRTEGQTLQLANDASDVQTTMHMVMNMLEGCIDGQEARALVDGCMKRIEESEAAIRQYVEENKAALTAEAEDREARTHQTTATAIASVEELEAQLERHAEKLDAEVGQLKQLVSNETDRCEGSLNEKINADVAALEQRFEKCVQDLEDVQRGSKDQLERETLRCDQLCTRMEDDSERVRTQLETLQADLDSAKTSLREESQTALSDARSALQVDVQNLKDSLGVVNSSLSQNLESQTEEIRLAVGKVGAASDAGLQQLQAITQHLESKIDSESQVVATAQTALDLKYKEQCEHLRDLITNIVADHTKQIGDTKEEAQWQHKQVTDLCERLKQDIEKHESNLIRESTESRALVEELRERAALAVDDAEKKFEEGIQAQFAQFKDLCQTVAKSVDTTVEHLRAELEDKVDGAVRETHSIVDVNMQTAIDSVQSEIHKAAEYSQQQMHDLSESFRSQIAETEGEVHAVHTAKCDELEAGLDDLRGLREEAELHSARIDDRFRALHTLQQIMHRSDTHDVFRRLDLGHDQKINKTEMKRGLIHLNMRVTDSELDELWALLDLDNSGDIDFQEFAAIGQMRTDVTTQLAEHEAQAQQQLDSLRTELADHDASVQNNIAVLHNALDSHAESAASIKNEAQTLSAALRSNLELAYERTETVKTQLLTQLDAEQDKNKQSFALLRDELSSVRSDVSSVDQRAGQLAAQVSTVTSSVGAAEETCQELNKVVLLQQTKSGDLSEKLERVITESARMTQKVDVLETQHETTKKDVLSRVAKMESEKHQLALKVDKVASESASTRTLNANTIASSNSAISREIAEVKSDVQRRLQGLETRSQSAVASIETLRTQRGGATEATRDETERRLAELGSEFERQLRERADKLEFQIQAAADAQRESAAGLKEAAAAMHKQMDEASDHTATQVNELRDQLTERSVKLENQLEWYMRYSKTLSAVLGDLEKTVDDNVRSLTEKVARDKHETMQVIAQLQDSLARLQAATPQKPLPEGVPHG